MAVLHRISTAILTVILLQSHTLCLKLSCMRGINCQWSITPENGNDLIFDIPCGSICQAKSFNDHLRQINAYRGFTQWRFFKTYSFFLIWIFFSKFRRKSFQNSILFIVICLLSGQMIPAVFTLPSTIWYQRFCCLSIFTLLRSTIKTPTREINRTNRVLKYSFFFSFQWFVQTQWVCIAPKPEFVNAQYFLKWFNEYLWEI